MHTPFESKLRLSHSKIWEVQRQFFSAQGVNAWNGQVPFYITSNPFIAHTYATLIMNYWQDQIQLGNHAAHEPFYIIELGTGTGQFSFYCLQKLLALKEQFLPDSVRFCYVMTDFTDSNLAFWEQHPALQNYLDTGVLDYAVFDGERSSELQLINQNITLKKGDILNPLVVIGNYLFDTLIQDVFCVQNHQLHEALVTTSTLPENLSEGAPKILKDIESRFEYQPTSGEHYYPNPLLNQVLASYPPLFKNGHFLFPIGGFTALQTLQSLCNDQLLLISTDKGYTDASELEERGAPSVICHGSISLSVNFHAMGTYFKILGGDAFFQSIRDTIRTCVFTLGGTLQQMPRLHQSARDLLEGFSPGDYFVIHRHFRETATVPFKTLLSHLTLSHWDPYLFSIFIEKFNNEASKLPLAQQQGLIQNICEQVLPNIYLLPGAQDHYFNAGLLFQNLKKPELAIECYQKSLDYHGEYFNALYNQALCWHALLNKDKALHYFERAKALEKDGQKAQEWITYYENTGRC